jgi:hypothetical protein
MYAYILLFGLLAWAQLCAMLFGVSGSMCTHSPRAAFAVAVTLVLEQLALLR